MQAWHILADGSPGAAVTLSADTGDSLSDGAFRPVYRVGAAPADH